MKNLKYFLALILVFLLISVRVFETKLFYDPFLFFFKLPNFNNLDTPNFIPYKLLLSLLFRFTLNSVLSLGIIYVLFRDKNITKFYSYILIIFFILLSTLYMISISNNFVFGYMPTFYIRRILIQPILLLIMIPSVYYFKYSKENNDSKN